MIAAIVMAAGFSRRMGQPKMLLPWGDTTVIGAVVRKLAAARIKPVCVVVGAARESVAQALEGLPVELVFNSRYQEDSMLLSLQAGLASLPSQVLATLVVLGDQPQMPLEVIQSVLGVYRRFGSALVVPSYRGRRGHPWLIDRCLWNEVAQLPSDATLRGFLNSNESKIHYIETQSEAVMQDLDTPEDYARYRPIPKETQPKK